MGSRLWPKRSTPRISPRAWAKACPRQMPTSSTVVVVVHPGVPGAGDGEVELSVAGKAGEHVVEEPHPGADVIAAGAV